MFTWGWEDVLSPQISNRALILLSLEMIYIIVVFKVVVKISTKVMLQPILI